MGKRIQYVDTAKGIIIFLMLLGHNAINLSLLQYIFSFHMPFFFFVYGYQVDADKLKTFGGISNKVKAYLVPYFVWALIYLKKFSYTSYGGILYGTKESIRTASSGYLWFLPCMFLAVFLYRMFMAKKPVRWGAYIGAGLLLSIIIASMLDNTSPEAKGLPWGINIAISGVGIMILGWLYRQVVNHYSGNKWIMSAITILCASLAFTYRLNAESLNGAWHRVAMSNAAYGNYGLYLLTAITQSILVLNVSMIIDNRVFQFVGRNTMTIYMMQGMIFALYNEVFLINIPSNDLAAVLRCTVTLLVALVFAVIINKFCPWLVGKQERVVIDEEAARCPEVKKKLRGKKQD